MHKRNPLFSSLKNIKNLKINRKVIGNRIVINIKDSYLLLGSSLRSLCKVFNTKVKKGIFPYGFVNDKNLNYQGSIPDKKYFAIEVMEKSGGRHLKLTIHNRTIVRAKLLK